MQPALAQEGGATHRGIAPALCVPTARTPSPAPYLHHAPTRHPHQRRPWLGNAVLGEGVFALTRAAAMATLYSAPPRFCVHGNVGRGECVCVACASPSSPSPRGRTGRVAVQWGAQVDQTLHPHTVASQVPVVLRRCTLSNVACAAPAHGCTSTIRHPTATPRPYTHPL